MVDSTLIRSASMHRSPSSMVCSQASRSWTMRKSSARAWSRYSTESSNKVISRTPPLPSLRRRRRTAALRPPRPAGHSGTAPRRTSGIPAQAAPAGCPAAAGTAPGSAGLFGSSPLFGKFFLSPLKIILDKSRDVCYSIPCCWTAILTSAGVAQPVEQLICNQQVGGSNPSTSSTISYGGVPEWPKGADCKSVAFRFGGPNPPAPTKPVRFSYGFIFYIIYPLACQDRQGGIVKNQFSRYFRKSSIFYLLAVTDR